MSGRAFSLVTFSLRAQRESNSPGQGETLPCRQRRKQLGADAAGKWTNRRQSKGASARTRCKSSTHKKGRSKAAFLQPEESEQMRPHLQNLHGVGTTGPVVAVTLGEDHPVTGLHHAELDQLVDRRLADLVGRQRSR